MSSFVLSCCSIVDLTREHLQKRDVHYACFHYMMDGKDCVVVISEYQHNIYLEVEPKVDHDICDIEVTAK